MTMRRILIVLAAMAAVALTLSAGASSRSDKTVQLRIQDGFTVKNTHILCEVEISKSLIPGVKVIGCVFASRSGAVPKTYEAALGVNGAVALAKVNKTGPPTVVSRKPSVSGADSPKLYYLASGDSVTVKGTAITCLIAGKKSLTKNTTVVTCFKIDAASGKPRPSTYGFGITDGGAFIARFDANSKAVPVKVVQHGK
jgi:hypothetical protein